MEILRTISTTALVLGALALCGAVCAQTNPLYEHRQSLGTARVQLILDGLVQSTSPDGRVVLDTLSARLIDDGIKSGDPVEIDLGTKTIRAYVGFSDELARARQFYAKSKEQPPFQPGVSLILNRLQPTAPIVLDSSTRGAAMDLGVASGQKIVVRYLRSGSPANVRAK